MDERMSDILRTVVTAIITLGILGVMGYGALTGVDTGVFEQYGAVVVGYWFGANAQGAVTRAIAQTTSTKLPSVL